MIFRQKLAMTTVDCYSPGQGLMPSSFKIRTVPLDENNEGFEVLDPDFGEVAIGRVAPVDSGMYLAPLLLHKLHVRIRFEVTVVMHLCSATSILFIFFRTVVDYFVEGLLQDNRRQCFARKS
jgi:hypothetical protein